MKHDADERAVDVHSTAVVINEAQVPEPIHEKTDSGAGCADHFGEGFLAHFRNERYRLGFLSKVGHQQEKPSEAFFAGIKEVIHQVRFHADVSGKQIGEKAFGKFRFLVEHAYHDSLLDPNDGAPFDGASGGHAKRLACQTALAKEASFRQDGNDGFFATLGYNRELYLAALDVEHRIRRIHLRKHGFISLVLSAGFSSRQFCQQEAGIECGSMFR